MDDGRRLRILLIDDDPTIREVVSHLLGSLGYACHTAPDGIRGLACFAEGGWDLVLTDLAMPGMTGWEVASAIRQQSPTTPIVLLTGLVNPEVLRHAGTQGLPVVAKPFRLEILKDVMATALRTSVSVPASLPEGMPWPATG
jgi:CheY-like chemotaxis protein